MSLLILLDQLSKKNIMPQMNKYRVLCKSYRAGGGQLVKTDEWQWESERDLQYDYNFVGAEYREQEISHCFARRNRLILARVRQST